MDERSDDGVDEDPDGRGRRAFLLLAGAAAAGGAATALASTPAGAQTVPPDITVDLLQPAVSLSGPEFLHGVQTNQGAAGDVAITATQLKQFCVPQKRAVAPGPTFTWDPSVTHIFSNNGSDFLTVLLPAYFSATVTWIPSITVVQMTAGRIRVDVASGALNTVLLSRTVTASSTRPGSIGLYSVMTITAMPLGPNGTVWIVAGDVGPVPAS
jgi:hypothetical protein